MRTAALRAVGGFDPERIAGEEPELCLRLRERGGVIRRIDAPMTVHDAAMFRFGQWWRRAMRAGYVEAEGVAQLGRRYPRHRALWSSLFWAVLLPVGCWLAAGVLLASDRVGAGVVLLLLPFAGYALAWTRIRRHAQRRWSAADAGLYATACLAAKWPAVQGAFVYWWRRVTRRPRRLIEYKVAGG